MKFNQETVKAAEQRNVELRGYSIPCSKEQTRPERIVRVAILQNHSVLPTTAPINDQRNAILKRVGEMIEIAAGAGANVVCMQETFSKFVFA